MDAMNKTGDDSTTVYGTPENTQATQADLPHLRDSADSTTTEKPVDQEEIQQQLHWIPTSPEEQTDISSGQTEVPSQDVHPDASPEYSDQSDRPGCNPVHEAEDPSSKDIYDTEGCDANNIVQCQLKDTCREEASAAAYQCGGEVDDANVDSTRTDVQVRDANSRAEDFEHDETRPETVMKKSKNAESSDQNKAQNIAASDDECIRPYAVAYQDGTATCDERVDAFDVQPYAVTYDEQDGHYENSSVNNSQSVCGQPGTSSETVDGKMDGLLPNPMYSGNALRPNPMYSGNALRPNPMYAPNAVQPRAGEGHSCVTSRPCLAGVITTGVVVAALTVLTTLIIATFMSGKQDNGIQTAIKVNEDPELTTIVFGGEGEEAGQLSGPSAVVVSPSNEIFVADTYNERVQVFNMTGAYLRHFPVIASGEVIETMTPEHISIDGEGHLWLAGPSIIVRCTNMGNHLTTLHPSTMMISGIAVDTRHDYVVVMELLRGYRQVKLLHFNGTVVRTFRVKQGSPGPVAVGPEGNIFVSDRFTANRVFVFNETGHYLFSLGDDQATKVSGLCVDSSGNVVVANWYDGTVELFAGDGRHVRRVVSGMFGVGRVAVGPGGQLVVTEDENSTVTIFSHY
ncbi:TRIM2 [Branchiostoma lanceolatum]|uniref:TRIM2 protein n=1 Tax=Branchiostoma lanceolatum TaxID=7740 RepID=A0A8J9ZTJ5_BRALA|nr:TRIM2 [Branchiostoma lanceolatum]